jgi:hypothetical protein
VKDDYGNTIKVGDKLSILVGIPGREVIVTVKKKRGHLIVEDEEGAMPLSEALMYYPSEVLKR